MCLYLVNSCLHNWTSVSILGSPLRVDSCLYIWPLTDGSMELLQIFCRLFVEDFRTLKQIAIYNMKDTNVNPGEMVTNKYKLSSFLVVFFQKCFKEIQPFWKAFVLVVFDEWLCFFFLVKVTCICINCMPSS